MGEDTKKYYKVNGEHQDNDLDLIFALILHAADISNPAKAPYKNWCDKIMEEFYSLGDKEKLFKRGKPICEVQHGFTKFFVKPIFVALDHIHGLDMDIILKRVDRNLAYWDGLAGH